MNVNIVTVPNQLSSPPELFSDDILQLSHTLNSHITNTKLNFNDVFHIHLMINEKRLINN